MKIVEFIGMPRTGKTTQIKKLCSYLQEKGVTFEVVTDRDFLSQIKTPIGNTFLYNKEFFSLMRNDTEKKIAGNPDFLLYDRGFFDQLVWSTDDVLLGNCTQIQKEDFDKEFEMYRHKDTYLIYLVASDETRKERHISSQEFTEIDSVVFSDDFLATLEESYKRVAESVFSKHQHYMEINSNQSEDKIFEEVINFIKLA